MLHRIKKLAGGLKTLLGFSGPKIVPGVIAGVSLQTSSGTIRREADQDDAWFFYLAGRSKHLYDIGANVGYTALLANVQGKVERLLLVDPNPEALALAAQNLILNNLAQRCEFDNFFLNNKLDEKIEFFTINSGAASSMYRGRA